MTEWPVDGGGIPCHGVEQQQACGEVRGVPIDGLRPASDRRGRPVKWRARQGR